MLKSGKMTSAVPKNFQFLEKFTKQIRDTFCWKVIFFNADVCGPKSKRVKNMKDYTIFVSFGIC